MTPLDERLGIWIDGQPGPPSAAFAAVVGRDGLIEQGATGVRSIDDATPVTVDDPVHIGSCAKSLTAALWARLVEEGTAAWDTPLDEVFGDLKAKKGWARPTITDLLHCRAGVAPNPPMREMADLMSADPAPDAQVRHRTSWAERVLSAPPRRPVRHIYSNLSYILAGAAVDRVAGEPYETALERLVLQPLGIAAAGFGPPPTVSGHRKRVQLGTSGFGRLRAVDPEAGQGDNPPLFNPAGRLHLPVAEWARFVQIFLNDGSPLITPDSMARLTTAGDDSGQFAMGWVPGADDRAGGLGMQGSNTLWSATAVIGPSRERAAMVVANRASTALLRSGVQLAEDLLDRA